MDSYSEWSDDLKIRAEKEYAGLLKQMLALIEALGLNGKVRIDTKILGKAVVDYIDDIVRLEQRP